MNISSQQKGHDGWDVIRVRMNKGPISQNTVFLLTVAPLLLFIILLSGDITGSGIGGLCIVSLVIASLPLLRVLDSRIDGINNSTNHHLTY